MGTGEERRVSKGEGGRVSRCRLEDLREDVLLRGTEVLLCELPERVGVGFVSLAEKFEEVGLQSRFVSGQFGEGGGSERTWRSSV